jgi:stress response protein YsnF
MLSSDDVQYVVGADAYGSDGAKIGKIGQVFLDDQTGEPVFATVNTGLFGRGETFIPLAQASVTQGRVDVGFDRETVKAAPHVSPDGGHLDPGEEQTLYDYYGLAYPTDQMYDDDATERESTYQAQTRTDMVESQPSTEADRAMTRSEEQLNVGKRREVTGRARLRKYVVTENVTVTVPVRREKAVLESVPVDESDVDVDSEIVEGAPLSGDSPEIVLREEVPVVETVVRPVERVRLGTEEYTDEETVTGEVRKERIALEGDVAGAEADLTDEVPGDTAGR